MKIVTWNIRHGGTAGSRPIASAILAHAPDVIVLTEHQTAKSHSLVEQLRFWGWPHVIASPTEGYRNGVAMLSKQPITPRPSPLGDPPFAWWAVEGQVEEIAIVGIYAPLDSSWGSSPQIQQDFWRRVHKVVETRRESPAILIGDFNTCARVVDGPNPQPCWDAFEGLPVTCPPDPLHGY